MKVRQCLILFVATVLLIGCEKKENQIADLNDDNQKVLEKSAQNIITDYIQIENWETVEGAYTDTIRIFVANLAQSATNDYMYFIKTDDDLKYIVDNLGETKQDFQKIVNTYPNNNYYYILHCRSYSDSRSYHHSDYIEYDNSSCNIRFHYDICVQPSADSIIGYPSTKIYLDIAAIPKTFFDGKQFDKLLSPKEMQTKEDELRKNVIVIE